LGDKTLIRESISQSFLFRAFNSMHGNLPCALDNHLDFQNTNGLVLRSAQLAPLHNHHIYDQ
jgi:hypothetical protein